MEEQTQAILEAALALPERARALVVERLLESLSPEMEEALEDDALAAELDRRRLEIQQGKVTPIPWSDVRLEE